MSFSDVFKSGFLESVSSFSVTDTLIGMSFALVLGLFIAIVYKKNFSGVMYSSGFALALPGLSLVTTLVLMAVTSNVVLSLGMVGALSIVRFRSAIKEPMEIVYLFWSLAIGIVIGAGIIPLAVIGSVIIGVVLLILANRKSHDNPYILVINCVNEAAENKALASLSAGVEKYVIKTKTVNRDGIEITAELRMKDAATSFVNRLCEIDGVGNAVLVSYNGEYLS